MNSFLQRLREKPYHVRQKIVISMTGFSAFLIFSVWVSTFDINASLANNKNSHSGNAPLAYLKANISDAYDNIRSSSDIDSNAIIIQAKESIKEASANEIRYQQQEDNLKERDPVNIHYNSINYDFIKNFVNFFTSSLSPIKYEQK